MTARKAIVWHMPKKRLELDEETRKELSLIVKSSHSKTRAYRRARCLLDLSEGKIYEEAATNVGWTRVTAMNLQARFEARGMEALEDSQRSGRPLKISGSERAKITALACSQPLEGHASWTLRMLAERAVELEYVEAISHTAVGTILKKTKSSHISRRHGA